MDKEQKKKTRQAIRKLLGMTEFMEGDKVISIRDTWWCKEGHIATVKEHINSTLCLKNNIRTGSWSTEKGFKIIFQRDEDFRFYE